jgi:hypothetical protein
MSKIQTEETIPKFGSENLNGRIIWKIYAYGRKILKQILRDYSVTIWTGLTKLRLNCGSGSQDVLQLRDFVGMIMTFLILQTEEMY